MKYMGSKNRIAKHIIPIMLEDASNSGISTWIEPFVGGANTIDKVPSSFTRVGYDLNPHTIQALIAIRDMSSELPDSVSEEHYKDIKGTKADPVSSWIRFVCSFGGRFEEGYARGGGRNFAAESKRNAIKQQPNIESVEFICLDYKNIKTTGSLIYCDPPYQGTKGYATGNFCHKDFFNWCREMKHNNNIVYISEYNAPDDFEVVWEGKLKTNFCSTRKEATHVAVEKLFKV